VGVFVSLEMFTSSQGIAVATTRFRFDGQPISATDTPISLEMEEGDTIEVYQQQTGGRGPYNCQNTCSFVVLSCWTRGLCWLSSDVTFITVSESSFVSPNQCHFDADKKRNVFELQKLFWVITYYNFSCVNSPLLLFQLSQFPCVVMWNTL
jgi:small ubiquitin-related modifier